MPDPVATQALFLSEKALGYATVTDEVERLPATVPSVGGPVVPVQDPSDFYYRYNGGDMYYDVIYGFRNFNGNAWTEKYICNASVSPTALVQLLTQPENINPRLAFLAASNRISLVTVRNRASSRLTDQSTVSRPGLLAIAPTDRADIAGTSIQYKWYGVNGSRRVNWMRGVMDSAVTVNNLTGEPTITIDTDTLCKLWVAACIRMGFGNLPRKKVDPLVPRTQYNRIVSVNGAVEPGYSTITCENDTLLTRGDRCTISLADGKTLPGLNGMWTVLAGAGKTFKVEYKTAQLENIAVNCGRMRVFEEDAFDLFAGAGFFNAVSRRTKNSFTRTRAGQSARGLRTLG